VFEKSTVKYPTIGCTDFALGSSEPSIEHEKRRPVLFGLPMRSSAAYREKDSIVACNGPGIFGRFSDDFRILERYAWKRA
jgi:hypothetical protein